MGPNRDPLMYTPDATPMVVGDRGLVIRSYAARVNGQTVTVPSVYWSSRENMPALPASDWSVIGPHPQVTVPSVSLFCHRLELSPPLNVTHLDVGDFFEMRLELL
eukprot:4283857-Pyramimonas_sp.AAC.2